MTRATRRVPENSAAGQANPASAGTPQQAPFPQARRVRFEGGLFRTSRGEPISARDTVHVMVDGGNGIAFCGSVLVADGEDCSYTNEYWLARHDADATLSNCSACRVGLQDDCDRVICKHHGPNAVCDQCPSQKGEDAECTDGMGFVHPSLLKGRTAYRFCRGCLEPKTRADWSDSPELGSFGYCRLCWHEMKAPSAELTEALAGGDGGPSRATITDVAAVLDGMEEGTDVVDLSTPASELLHGLIDVAIAVAPSEDPVIRELQATVTEQRVTIEGLRRQGVQHDCQFPETDVVRVAGWDPGFAHVGLMVIDFAPSYVRCVHRLKLTTTPDEDDATRLDRIARLIDETHIQWLPTVVAYENVAGVHAGKEQAAQHASAAARRQIEVLGMLRYSALRYRATCFAIAAVSARKAVLGAGNTRGARKRDTLRAVQGLLGIGKLNQEMADAGALAIAGYGRWLELNRPTHPEVPRRKAKRARAKKESP
jgi:Holliday junction resolvasome RuvABC endonuclease subunit